MQTSLQNRLKEFIENCDTVTCENSQQACKIPKRPIANYAGIAKFKTACQKIQYQRKNLLITYFSLCSMWSPSSSTTKHRRFFQAKMFLRISPTEISSYDKKNILSFNACSVNLSLIPR